MIDIHCHLLPGIDDGPSSLENALALARELVNDGITHAVCTPHVFPGRFENRRSNIAPHFAHFQEALEASGIPLDLRWAGEARLNAELIDLIALDEVPFLGTFKGYRMMLLEMPDGQVPLGSIQFARRMLTIGIRPVIVHPERNRGVMERPERLRDFLDAGCLVQVTAGSLVGQFGTKAQQLAHKLVDQGWAHAVASDAHNLGGRRPRMSDASKYLTLHWGSAYALKLTHDIPAALCNVDVS